MESQDARLLVELYFSCKDMGQFPSPGGYFEQTAFTVSLFNYISDIVEKTRARNAEKAQSKANSRK